jgi:cell division protein FtsN
MVRRKVSKRKTRSRNQSSNIGWLWMFFGLAIGLSVAAAIYVSDRKSKTNETAPEPAAEKTSQPKEKVKSRRPTPEDRFDFYDMLPNFEVIIPEEDLDARPDVEPAPVASPGLYVLQAGSFSNYADADRMKARLALLGIVSRIQKVSVDDNDYHRVRIGPVQSLDELNILRGQLRDARIEVMVIRVGK